MIRRKNRLNGKIRRNETPRRFENLETRYLLAGDASAAISEDASGIEADTVSIGTFDEIAIIGLSVGDAVGTVIDLSDHIGGTSMSSIDGPNALLHAAIEALNELQQAEEAGFGVGEQVDQNDFANSLDEWFGQLGGGTTSLEDFLGGNTVGGSSITDPTTGESIAGDQEDVLGSDPFRVSTDDLGAGVASDGGSSHESNLDLSPRGPIIIQVQNGDDGSRVVTRFYYDTSGELLAIWTKANLADGSAFQSSEDVETGQYQEVWYDENGEEINEDVPTDELSDPDSTEGGGWTPPWHDSPDNSADVKDGIAQVIPDPNTVELGTNTQVQMEVDPQIAVINPNPEAGHEKELNPDDTPQWPQSTNQELPPGPFQT